MSEHSNISNNSGPGSAAEPSMEEILASIRRILREDEGARAPAEDADDDILVLKSSMVADDDVLVLKDSMLADDDMLVLDSSMMTPADISTATELPAETGLFAAHDEVAPEAPQEPVHFASEPTIDTHMFDQPVHEEVEPEPEAVAEELVAPAPEPEVPEPVAVHEVVVAAAPEPEPPAPPPPEPEPEPEAEPEEVFTRAAFAPPPLPARQKETIMETQIQSPEFLIGEEASNAVANSIGSLMRSITTDRAVSVRPGGLTIEDIVREEIRPVLKAWFDTHLPTLVERIVRAEVGRVVDRTQV